jgi:formamidase
MCGSDGTFDSMGEGMIVGFDGQPLVSGGGRPDEIVTAEVRPDLVREARRVWGVENNIYQFGHRGYVAVRGGAQDCPYTYMQDLVAGRYRLPWEDEVVHRDGGSCGFPAPTRPYAGPAAPKVRPRAAVG